MQYIHQLTPSLHLKWSRICYSISAAPCHIHMPSLFLYTFIPYLCTCIFILFFISFSFTWGYVANCWYECVASLGSDGDEIFEEGEPCQFWNFYMERLLSTICLETLVPTVLLYYFQVSTTFFGFFNKIFILWFEVWILLQMVFILSL